MSKNDKVRGNNLFRNLYIRSWFIFIVLLFTVIKIKAPFFLTGIHKLPRQIAFILICLIGPIIEEFVYRYLVFRFFDKDTWAPYLFSFFTFVLIHFRGDYSFEGISKLFLTHGFSAVAFIFIYKETDWNLFFPILFHCLVNFIMFSGVLSWS